MLDTYRLRVGFSRGGFAWLAIAPELEPRPDHASYLRSWLSVLANDKRAIFQAAAHAQRAVSFLHSLQPETVLQAAA